MLKSDTELVEASGVTLESLRRKAAEILAQFAPQTDTVEAQPAKGKKRKKTKKSKNSDSDRSLTQTLFEAYSNTELIEVQEKYAKEYRISVHQWSYGRLIANIRSSAAKAGIVIEESKQPIRGSPEQKARKLALVAYHSRQKT
ncbi:hypothetical protein [Nostoc sp. FACHB-110]|uniref:hypothetical protein n=1 Tax=Nostoc sp. FACHB-110 TaxID=2692834 RepID=UPI001F555266|nr:hypothetical protein [Nostoc sp. FACHB-110]